MKLFVNELFVEQFYDSDLANWYISINGCQIIQISHKLTAQQIIQFIEQLETEGFL